MTIGVVAEDPAINREGIFSSAVFQDRTNAAEAEEEDKEDEEDEAILAGWGDEQLGYKTSVARVVSNFFKFLSCEFGKMDPIFLGD